MAKKKTVDLFAEDTVEQGANEFDALLNSSTGLEARRFSTGDAFRGEILAVSGQEAFVSTGTATDAVMPFVLVPNKEAPKAGDIVDVVVVRAREGQILVRAAGSLGVRTDGDSLEDAFHMQLPVQGVVVESIKGGFKIKIQDHRAFCPVSQIDWRCITPEDYVGKKFDFLITKWERGRDLVVSRRRILENERKSSEASFLTEGEVGAIYSSTVFRLEKYGAFVRLENGIEGLVPISELSFGRINHPQEVVRLEQIIQVKLLAVKQEEGRLKVSFSLKQGGSIDDPWATLEHQFPLGSQVEGTIEHKEHFGIFVNIANGVTGLLPRSAWRESTDAGQIENKRKGDKIKVRVDRIDLDQHKLSFSLGGEDQDDSWKTHSSTVNKSSLGSLGDLMKDAKRGKN